MRRTPKLLFLVLCLPGAAAAQVELSLVAGYRGGDATFLVEAEAAGIACLVPPCVVAEARTPESEALGLLLDVPLRPGWMFEALLSRQDGSLRLASSLPPEAGPVAAESFELTVAQVGLMRRRERRRLKPFVAVGVGVARVETSAAVLAPPIGPGEAGQRLGSRERASASLAAGVHRPIDARWGLRLEARGYWIDLPGELGGDLVQVEASVGLSVRPTSAQ